MRPWTCRSCVASLMAALWATTIEAVDSKRYDGIHRVEKHPQITQAAVLERRADVCGTSMKLCPSSLSGGCCPQDYDCATESCYATTKGPSTCGTKVGWYVCAAVYGGGCCPDGYVCQTADECIPPSGSAYTYGCPTSQYLCPASLSYGCCPNGMACATNQCYSTEPVTMTETVVVTTTESGSQTTFNSTRVTVQTPSSPTLFPTVDSGNNNNNDQYILKYFPTAIAKVTPTTTSESSGGGGGLSTGALGGIIAGSVAFLIIVLVAAYIIIRHLNNVVAAVSTSRQSDGSKARPPMKEFKQADSEGDTLSVDPLMMIPPRTSAPGPDSSSPSPYNLASPDFSSNDHTPSAGVTGYQPVSTSAGNSRHTSFDAAGNEDYFNNSGHRLSAISAPTTTHRRSNDSHGTYMHVRNHSNASDGSDGVPVPGWNQSAISELEASPYVPELPHSPSSVAFPRDDRRRSSGSTVANTPRPSVSHSRQRNRSESLGQPALDVVNEEMHGFHGPSDHLVGQTDSHRPGTAGWGKNNKNQGNRTGDESQGEGS